MDSEKQMSLLLEEGGIADDGMEKDPVSGNEVPPGSMASEVRDDIPAQLSEGEYVVPADVLRYYGVKFFEDLRSRAKMGLGQMERDGRIGGEPVDMSDDFSDLTPEERAELEGIMGFDEGGLSTQVLPDFSKFAAGYSFMGDTSDPSRFPGAVTQRNVVLYGPGGEVVNLTLPTDQERYEELLGEGYSETPGQQEIQEAEPPRDSGGGGGGGGAPEYTPPDYSEIATEDLKANLEGMVTIGKVSSGISALVSPIAGLITNMGFRSNMASIVSELENRGEDMSDFREENGKAIFGGGLSLFDGLQDQEDSKEGVGFDDTWLGDLLGFDGQAGVQGPGLRESRAGARRGQAAAAASTSSTGTPTTSSDDDDNNNSDNTNVGNYGGDRDGDGVPNVLDFDDGVGWADRSR